MCSVLVFVNLPYVRILSGQSQFLGPCPGVLPTITLFSKTFVTFKDGKLFTNYKNIQQQMEQDSTIGNEHFNVLIFKKLFHSCF